MKYLITGANGQLAQALIALLQQQSSSDLITLKRSDLDISNSIQVGEILSQIKPDIVINTAAYNHVDHAETDEISAMQVNRDGPASLANWCSQHKRRLVHYSSDYIFDGHKGDFYDERDTPEPLNVYGQSKLAGEQAVLQYANTLVLRLSWVYGHGDQNFFAKLATWIKSRNRIDVVYDQISIPTSTELIAALTLKAIMAGLTGCYHLTNSGYASRYETARAFLKAIGHDCLVLPVPSSQFAVPAKRPFFSAMSNAKLAHALQINIPDWETSLAQYCRQLPT